MLTVPRLILAPSMLKEMISAQQTVLGPRDQRTKDKPDPRNPIGGTQLERVVKPACVSGSPRAFQMCASDQMQTKCNSPVAWGKIPNRHDPIPASVSDLDEGFRMRYEVVNVDMLGYLCTTVINVVQGFCPCRDGCVQHSAQGR